MGAAAYRGRADVTFLASAARVQWHSATCFAPTVWIPCPGWRVRVMLEPLRRSRRRRIFERGVVAANALRDGTGRSSPLRERCGATLLQRSALWAYAAR